MKNQSLACIRRNDMSVERRTNHAPGVRPLHFELQCPAGNMLGHIKGLHGLATDCHFLSLTEIVSFSGNQCAVEENEPYEGLKVRARHTLMIGPDRALSIEPDALTGFCGLLPNGSHFCIGLAVYPEIIVLPSGDIVATGLAGKAFWQGFVQTIRVGQCGDTPKVCACPIPGNCPSACVRSHQIVIKILDQAKSLGILQDILDPAMYWEIRDEARLTRAIQRSKGFIVEHV